MNNYIIIGIVFIFFCIFSYIGYLYMKSLYRKYDERESKKEELDILKKSIMSAREFFMKTYNTDFDDTVWKNVKENTDFMVKLIECRGLDDKLRYYDKLFKMLYETEYRLKTKTDNIMWVMEPLRSLRNELYDYHMMFIRKYMD